MRDNAELLYKPDNVYIGEWHYQWLELRNGLINASTVYKIMSDSVRKYKGATPIQNYAKDVVQSIIEGVGDGYTNQDMENGNAFERDALEEFERRHKTFLAQLTFLKVGDYVGISSDGLECNLEFGVEVKSPHFKGFSNYCNAIDAGVETFKNVFPEAYGQMQTAIWGYNFDYYYFVAFHSKDYQKGDKQNAKDRYIEMKIPKDNEYQDKLSIRIEETIKLIKNELEIYKKI